MSSVPPDKDYEVGYGRPPVATRFQKGQSGNPKGAKRKVRPTNMADAIDAALQKKVPVMRKGKRKSLTMMEVVAERMVGEAAAGDRHARRELMRFTRENSTAKVAQTEPKMVDVYLKLGPDHIAQRVEDVVEEERRKREQKQPS